MICLPFFIKRKIVDINSDVFFKVNVPTNANANANANADTSKLLKNIINKINDFEELSINELNDIEFFNNSIKMSIIKKYNSNSVNLKKFIDEIESENESQNASLKVDVPNN